MACNFQKTQCYSHRIDHDDCLDNDQKKLNLWVKAPDINLSQRFKLQAAQTPCILVSK